MAHYPGSGWTDLVITADLLENPYPRIKGIFALGGDPQDNCDIRTANSTAPDKADPAGDKINVCPVLVNGLCQVTFD